MAFVTPVVEHWLEQEIAQWLQLGFILMLEKGQSLEQLGRVLTFPQRNQCPTTGILNDVVCLYYEVNADTIKHSLTIFLFYFLLV